MASEVMPGKIIFLRLNRIESASNDRVGKVTCYTYVFIKESNSSQASCYQFSRIYYKEIRSIQSALILRIGIVR